MSNYKSLISVKMMLLLIMGHGPSGIMSERPKFRSSLLFGSDEFFEHDGDRYVIRATFHNDLQDRGARSVEGTFRCPRGSTSPVSSCSLDLTTSLKDVRHDGARDARRWRIEFSYDRRVLNMTIFSDKRHCRVAIEMSYATVRMTFAKMINVLESEYYDIPCVWSFDEVTAEEAAERDAFENDILGPASNMLTTFLEQIVNDNPFSRITLRDAVPYGAEIVEGGVATLGA